MKPRDDPKQLTIDWANPQPPSNASTSAVCPPSAIEPAKETLPSLVQRLPWDFSTTFPEPTEDAIETGQVNESDREPENLKSLHECYASQCLGTLKALDTVMDARRRGVDPGTGKAPRSKASRERLSKYLAEERGRLERQFDVLIKTYENAFGDDAATAFTKFVCAREAGIDVVIEPKRSAGFPPTGIPDAPPRRLSSQFPVPEPLRSSVAAGVFGHDEKGEPIRPEPDEVRAITEQHAERMIAMNEADCQSAIAKYAEDFGQPAADQLVRHIQCLRPDLEMIPR